MLRKIIPDIFDAGGEPNGPTSQLLRLLDQHPELIEELRGNT